MRAVAEEAYAAGARFVDVLYTDQRVRRAHIEHAPDDELGWSPPWLVKRLDDLGADGGALLSITGNPEPELFADLDGGRVGRARMREVAEASLRLTRRRLQLVDRRVPQRGLGDERSSASPTSSGSGRRSRPPFGSTSPTRSRPGGSTSRRSAGARRR